MAEKSKLFARLSDDRLWLAELAARYHRAWHGQISHDVPAEPAEE